MKNVSEELSGHIGSDVTTLATCWKLVTKSGDVMGFTDHDKTLVIDEVEYLAETGFTPSAVQSTAGFAVDNLDIEGMLDSASITEDDIHAGFYDFAEIEVFMVNYTDLTQGKLLLRTGWLGEVSYGRNYFVAEVRGLAQALSQKIGDVFSPSCRATLGDAKCGVDMAGFTETGTITGVVSNRVFGDSALSNPTEYFNYGKITFTSGANDGISMEVKDYVSGGNITLVLPMPYDVEIGDSYEIQAGCDKNIETCISRFDNAINFRGEPHVPGMDKILETSATRSK